MISHFESGGHTLDLLVHLMAFSHRGRLLGVASAVSATDETTGWYGAKETLHPFFRATVRPDRLRVDTPTGSIQGSLDDLRVRAGIRNVEIDVTLRAVGHPLYNRGTGRFDMLGMDVHQYSVPTMETTGRLVVDGREHPASGVSWFDRQWQQQSFGPPTGRWTWMDLNLSNGWRISLWDAVGTDHSRDGWVTVVDENGTHTVAELIPLQEDAHRYWSSPRGSRFPTCWLVRVPTLETELRVAAVPPEQAIGALHERYEGASTVSGTVRGAAVDGHCYVEMVGDWKP